MQPEVRHIPVAERVRKTPAKEYTIDITCARLFLTNAELRTGMVAVIRQFSTTRVLWPEAGLVCQVVQLLFDAIAGLYTY